MDLLGNIIGPLFWYIVAISVLITVHEFGHFWVARRAGVTIKRFSIGFGKPLWLRRGRDGTEYALSMIPLGGYVSMLDDRFEDVPAAEAAAGAHNHKHPFAKILIAFAGPLFNLLLAVALFWLVFVIGKPDYPPIIGTPSGEMARSGFAQGDEIRSADGQPVTSWEQLGMAIGMGAAYRRDVQMTGVSRTGEPFERVLALSGLTTEGSERDQYLAIGYRPDDQPIAHALPDPTAPAAKAGIQVGDRFLTVNGQAVATAGEFFDQIQAGAATSAPIKLELDRSGTRREVFVTPRQDEVGGQTVYRIGVQLGRNQTVVTQYGPVKALGRAVARTAESTWNTVVILKDMLVGALSPKQISGPITIARVAEMTAEDGPIHFLGLLAVISVGLAVLNLLPVPILDGGHILYYSIEWIRGRVLSERELVTGQAIGMAMLAGLIGLAFFNDFARLFE
ncbi:MAG: RIP metalloprotease RseP [Ahniella sp.]|nr:RIP metalloprotease RseP [Ahniella sp.]